MSLFNALRTSVSGMNAQSSALSAISDNIANSGTVGYKDAQTQFETVLGQQTPASYESGGVLPVTRYDVNHQGTLTSSSSSTDLAVQGNGFFVVSQGGTGANLLTRAGSFVADKTGNLVNTAGYTLMAYQVGSNGTVSPTLSTVNVSSSSLKFAQSTSATNTGNLPSTDTNASPTRVTQATIYDSTGAAVVANVNYQSLGSDKWNVTVTNPTTGASYGATPTTPTAAPLTFNSSGQYVSGGPINLSVPSASGGTSTAVSFDMSGLTQVASSLSAVSTVDGFAPSAISSVTIDKDGTLTGVYGNGTKSTLYKIPLATVTSPDNLTSITGDVFQQSNTSGSVTIQSAETGPAGSIASSNLEASTVDLATELTNMITIQRSYEANSKVLQAASSLLGNLNQIQTS